MPMNCSAPGCTSNYNSDEHVPVFKLPEKPDELRQAWIRALRRDDIDDFKRVYVCVKHFREEDIECMHRVPNGDGTFREEPRARPKVKEGAVPVFLPGCPSISQPTTSTDSRRLSLDSREEELLNQTLSLSLKPASEEKVKFKINTFQELQAKLSSLSLSKLWPLWYPDDSGGSKIFWWGGGIIMGPRSSEASDVLGSSGELSPPEIFWNLRCLNIDV